MERERDSINLKSGRLLARKFLIGNLNRLTSMEIDESVNFFIQYYLDNINDKLIEDNNCNVFNYDRKRETIDCDNSPFDPKKDIFGNSIGGTYTSFTIPKLKTTCDAGNNFRNIKSEKNIVISHTDFDHFDIESILGLMCISSKERKRYKIYLSEKSKLNERYKEILERKEILEEYIKPRVDFVFVREWDKIEVRKGLIYEFFPIIHSPTSIGFSIKKKEKDNWKRIITYTGDLSLIEMKKRNLIRKIPQLWDTETLIIENSSTASKRKILIGNRFHNSTKETKWLINKGNNKTPANIKNLILIHYLGKPPYPMCFLTCQEIRYDIIKNLSKNNLNVYYLTSCQSGKLSIKMFKDLKTPIQILKSNF